MRNNNKKKNTPVYYFDFDSPPIQFLNKTKTKIKYFNFISL